MSQHFKTLPSVTWAWCVSCIQAQNGSTTSNFQEVVLQPATQIPPQPSHTKTPTHIETRTHDQCGDSIEKSQASDDGCINVRNVLSIEEVK